MNVIKRWLVRRDAEQLRVLLAVHRWDALAQYNAEVSHGIVHTPEYQARMAREQAAFNADPNT